MSLTPSTATLGIIGFGNMAQAVTDGLLREDVLPADHILVLGRNRAKLEKNAAARGVIPAANEEDLIRRSDVILLGVLPPQVLPILDAYRDLFAQKLVLSLAAGLSTSALKEHLPESSGVITFLPNTPVAVAAGIFITDEHMRANEEQRAFYEALFSSIASIEYLPQNLVSAATAIAGCGPAFASMMAEALGDAAVKNGIPRDKAYRLAAAMLRGVGSLLLESGTHPAVIKDGVCSPGGTTICGVTSLEEDGFRSSLVHAVDAVIEREKEL